MLLLIVGLVSREFESNAIVHILEIALNIGVEVGHAIRRLFCNSWFGSSFRYRLFGNHNALIRPRIGKIVVLF